MTEQTGKGANALLEEGSAHFERLALRGLQEIDPLSYDLCSRLLARVFASIESGKSARVEKLLSRLQQTLSKSELVLDEKSALAQKQVDLIKKNSSTEFSQAVLLKQSHQYEALSKLYHRLNSQSAGTKLFVDLKGYLEKHDWSQSSQEAIGLDSLLYDLNENDCVDENSEGLKPLKAASEGNEQLEELKSLQNYREYLGRVVTENMVRQVIKEDPENAGPLNPQRLLVRTLSAMKDLSPSYVNRLVPYFDSLMTLEEMSNAQ